MNKKRISRRTMIVGGGVAATFGAVATGLTVRRLFAPRYASKPYDDLLARLADRGNAVQVGAAMRFTEPTLNVNDTVRELRQRFERRTLVQVTSADIEEGRITEAGGWVLPQSLAQLCALAAV